MPQAANIVINDGAATPVLHTFTPMGKDKNGVLWFIQVAPAPLNRLGAKRIGYKVDTDPTLSKQLVSVTKSQYSFMYPLLEVLGNAASGLTPPATVAYTLMARLAVERPDRALTQEAKDLRAIAINFLTSSMATSNIDDNNPTYS
jgi:hypothetical protein